MKMFISKKESRNWFLLFLFSVWINVISSVEASDSGEEAEAVCARVEGSSPAHVTQSNPDNAEKKELKGNLPTPSEEFIQTFIKKEYYRPLVTRFIKACPSQKNLATATGVTSPTISKLKKPEVYGKLTQSAQRVWEWIHSKDITSLKKELSLEESDIKTMAYSLGSLNLSNQNIVYDDLAKKLSTSGEEDSSEPFLVSEVVAFLQPMRGTIREINFAHNLISDEGLYVLVRELMQHSTILMLNLGDNMITDKGLLALEPLLGSVLLELLDLSKNYGPSSDEVLAKLYEAVPRERRTKIKIIAEDIE